jgi:hypothetical protein
MFEFLIFLSIAGVFAAIGHIREERRRREKAREKWERFKEDLPSKK